MRFHWFGASLGLLLLTAPALAERNQNYKKYRSGDTVTNFSAAPSKRKKEKARRDFDFFEFSRSYDDGGFARPSPDELAPVDVNLLPEIEQGNLPYVSEKFEFLRALKLDETRPAEPVADAIYDALLNKAATFRVTSAERQAILAHYRATGFKPLWIEGGGLSERAKKLAMVFEAAEDEGLDPTEFQLNTAAGESGNLAEIELSLTVATLRYARQASGGRLLPNRLSTYNDLKPERIDPRQALRILAYTPFPSDYLMRLHPTHKPYSLFKMALAELRKESIWDDEPIPGGPRVKPGQVNFRIPAVRGRLARLRFLPGDMPREQLIADGVPQYVAANATYESASKLLDPQLAKALKDFQKERSIKATGALDVPTVKALNTNTQKQDMQRLVANMERLRWLPKDLGERHIFVNQAAFELRVVDQDQVLWRTNVVVGKPETQTSSFHDQLETVVFNPPWGVPLSIVRNEMLPILWRDPSYLDRQGFKVYDENGKVVKSRSINWAQYGANPPFAIQQPPGDDNALGELKFLFPNSHAIYMHDTPSKSLFSKPVRAFSHGCVRIQNPRELARIVLGMNLDKIGKHIASGKSETVPVPRKLPVHLTYFTAWPGENGKVNFYGDIYGRDAAMTEVFTVMRLAQR